MNKIRMEYLQIRFDKIFNDEKEKFFSEAEDSEEREEWKLVYVIDEKMSHKLLQVYLDRCNTFHFMACMQK